MQLTITWCTQASGQCSCVCVLGKGPYKELLQLYPSNSWENIHRIREWYNIANGIVAAIYHSLTNLHVHVPHSWFISKPSPITKPLTSLKEWRDKAWSVHGVIIMCNVSWHGCWSLNDAVRSSVCCLKLQVKAPHSGLTSNKDSAKELCVLIQ